MKKANSHIGILQMVQLAMLSAVAIILVAFVRIPLVPAAPFLVYDMADAPIIIVALMFGTLPALAVLFVVSLIQAIAFDTNGWVGLLMHFVASGSLVVLVGQFYKKRERFSDAIIGMALGTVAMTLLMIPMNYIFTVHVFGTPKDVVDAMMLPGIIPFNFLKAALNSIIAAVLFKALQPFFKRNRQIIKPV